MHPVLEAPVITRAGARDYFHESLQSALSNQKFPASDESVIYLVNMLMSFISTDRLFEKTPDGMMIRPLALVYCEALQTRNEADRTQAMQRLGDVALFISGLYANSLNRSLVDVDYYIAMGGHAYSYLADRSHTARCHQAVKRVFDELSSRFAGFVEILSEVGEQWGLNGNTDIMRLYELWQCTGSERIARKLQALGIMPVRTIRATH